MNYLSQPMTAMRPLGSIEHMFWLKDLHMPYHFAVCAEIEGPTTVEAWRKALDMVQRRHPNFRVKIELDQAGKPSFVYDPDARISLRVVASDNARWESEFGKEMGTPFDPQKAPLVRNVLLHQARRSYLIVAAHHSIADTKSLVFAIRDALKALAGESLDSLAPIDSFEALLTRVARPNADDAPREALAPAAAGKQDVFRTPDGSFPHIESLTLTSALTSELRRRSRREETTVHGALIAAAAEATRQISSELREATISVGSAIDARTMMGAGEDVALLSAGASVSIEPHSRAFWETARLAKREIAPSQSAEAMFHMMESLEQVLADGPDAKTAADLMAGFRFDINISNLGVLPIETRFGALTFKALWGPSILAGFEGEQEIGVATVNGSLTLLHTSYRPLPSFLNLIEQRLIAACA
ncbi:MAG: condensation domain-containing protein [Methylocella sp.]